MSDVKFQHRLYVAFACVAVTFFLAGSLSTLALLQWTVRLGSTASVKAVGIQVYRDAQCTEAASHVDWGMLSPGENRTVVVYVKNVGNVPVTLSLRTEAWNPAEAAAYIGLTWTCEGSVVAAGGVREAALTLNVNSQVQGVTSFSFTIVVVGVEVNT